MLSWYVQEYVQQARYEDFVREAERQRCIHIALSSSDKYSHRFRRGLIWLGSQLVA
jgi:hypothetical protein